MSIVEQEAEKRYPDLVFPGYPRDQKHFQQVYTSDDLQEAYMQGADREPTDAEIEAAARALYEAWRPASYPKWDQYKRCSRVEDYLAAARVTLTAARNKATEETE
ncbi:hypothetical protein [Bifidobacterium callitrichos]|uniref:Uncharacterized protein n=1 Tax=Bifidobacterium callitrichos DSM 23973 TaxID=1437609 RepID=A0A087ACR4_9BIFI|nr:hypothetical protein [Bifidobacterium callitrichos]KFI56564.1 hypothetical protein BCAL_0159 [Bifidobacterium callitrichos DSM 23973]